MRDLEYLNSLENLTGKTAVVTGGSQGIGLQTTILLGCLGATVYICALDGELDRAGVESAREEVSQHTARSGGSVHFHKLDLSSIESSRSSAHSLKKKISQISADGDLGRLDIVVCNAAIAFSPQSILSPDGYERTFAVNCLGHFVFVTSLMDIIDSTARVYGDARITFTSSRGYTDAKKLDYKALTTPIPDDGTSLLHLKGAFQRYLDSKLAVLYLAKALDQDIWVKSSESIFINVCHPGQVPNTALGEHQQPLVRPWLASMIKSMLRVFMKNTTRDAARTQVFLSASSQIREKKVHGEYWAPTWSRSQKYTGTGKEELSTALAKDEKEWQLLWNFCQDAVSKVP